MSTWNDFPKDSSLKDYKFFCFNGEPLYCQVISNRFKDETIDFYDTDWVHQEFTGLALPDKQFKGSSKPIPIPISFDLMKIAAKELAKDMPFVRIDFYDVCGHMYFGEITLYPASGFGEFTPNKWNKIMGSKINCTT